MLRFQKNCNQITFEIFEMDTDKHTRIRVEETKHKQSDKNPFLHALTNTVAVFSILLMHFYNYLQIKMLTKTLQVFITWSQKMQLLKLFITTGFTFSFFKFAKKKTQPILYYLFT